MDLSHVLWIGGPEAGVRSAVSRAVADRFGFAVYALAEHATEHEPRMPAALSEVTQARHRFRLVLEDLRDVAGPGLVVEGEELLPTSVSAFVRSQDQALFILPAGESPLAREARELRFAVLPAEAPLDELVELACVHFARAISAAGDTSP